MELALEAQELLDFGTIPAGTELTCRAGRVWLTMSGDQRDHILRPGQRFVSQDCGHLLVNAIAPCRLEITHMAPVYQNKARWQQLIFWTPRRQRWASEGPA